MDRTGLQMKNVLIKVSDGGQVHRKGVHVEPLVGDQLWQDELGHLLDRVRVVERARSFGEALHHPQHVETVGFDALA